MQRDEEDPFQFEVLTIFEKQFEMGCITLQEFEQSVVLAMNKILIAVKLFGMRRRIVVELNPLTLVPIAIHRTLNDLRAAWPRHKMDIVHIWYHFCDKSHKMSTTQCERMLRDMGCESKHVFDCLPVQQKTSDFMQHTKDRLRARKAFHRFVFNT